MFLPALLVVVWAAICNGCFTKSCTDMGCISALSVTLRTSDGSWPEGAYDVALSVDGVETVCSFRLPEKLPSSAGASTGLNCGTDVRFEIRPESQCEMGCDVNTCWQGCRPIPGKFVQAISVNGTPSQIELSVVRDGQEILAKHVDPNYQETFPNGPECGPACRHATLEFAIP
jgi:hypothetical protein